MEIQEKIIQAFVETGDAMRAGEVAEKLGVEKKEVEKAIKKMTTTGLLHSPKRCFYDIVR